MTPSTQQALTNLLRANSMTPDTLDGPTLTQLFLSQMRISLYGGKSSIPMLPTFCKPFGTLAEGVPVAVAEVDDQEVRVCLVTFSGGQAQCDQRASFPVPGREYPAPLDDLLYAVAELIQPLLDTAKALALCLPFPVDYDGKGDGAILRFPGTMTVTDFVGQPVLAALRAQLEERGCPLPPMTLVSEPDAVLLAAGVQHPGQSRYVGLTWGSGLDLGFAAPGSIVLRRLGIAGDLTLFDGGFSQAQCVPFGQVDFSKDRDSYAPGEDLYLKMVSTDYLGEVYRLVMIKAAEAKLLSFGCSRDVLSLRWLGLDTLVELLEDPEKGGTLAHFCREPEDREVGLTVGQAVLDRAARLLCANLAAVLQFVGAGRDPKAPACVGLHGAAFAFPPVKAALEHWVQADLRESRGLSLTLWQGEDMLPTGAAAAALYQG